MASGIVRYANAARQSSTSGRQIYQYELPLKILEFRSFNRHPRPRRWRFCFNPSQTRTLRRQFLPTEPSIKSVTLEE